MSDDRRDLPDRLAAAAREAGALAEAKAEEMRADAEYRSANEADERDAYTACMVAGAELIGVARAYPAAEHAALLAAAAAEVERLRREREAYKIGLLKAVAGETPNFWDGDTDALAARLAGLDDPAAGREGE